MTPRRGTSVLTRWWLFQYALLALAIGRFSADGRDSQLTESTSIVCDNEDLDLSCPADHRLVVTRTLYGRSDTMTCSQDASDVTCPPVVPLADVGRTCYGSSSSCNIEFSSLSLPQGCVNVTNYLNVTFVCIPESSLTSLCNTFQGIGNASIGFLSSPSTSSSGSCSVTLTPSDGQVVSLDLIYLDLSTSQSHENSSLLLLGNHSFSLQYSFTTFPDQTLTMLTFTNLTVSYIPDGTVFILQYNVFGCKAADIPTPFNGHISSYSSGQQASFACDSGFTLDGAGVVTCEGSSWVGDAGTCSPVIECGLLSAIPNGQVIQTGVSVGSTVNYSCIGGFQLSVDVQRVCQPDGTWDGQEPRCNRVVCSHPGIPGFGRTDTTFISYLPGTVVTFSCIEGYVLDGANATTCGTDGIWDRPRPSCGAIDCGEPDSIVNADVTYNDTGYGSVAVYTCGPGPLADVIFTVICSNSGSWNDSLISCGVITTVGTSSTGAATATEIGTGTSSTGAATATATAPGTGTGTTQKPGATSGQPTGLVPGVLVAAVLVLLIFAAIVIYIKCYKKKDPKSASTRRLPVDTEGDWYDGRTSVDYSCTRMRSNGSINAKKEGIPENHVTHVNEQNHEKQNHSNHCNNVKNNNTLPPEMTANTSRTGVRNPVYVSSMPSVGPGDESTTGSKTAATAQSKNNLPETETTYM